MGGFVACILTGLVRVAAKVLPQTGFIKPEMLRRIDFLAQLPLPSNAGGITGFFEQVSECGLRTVQHAELDVVAHIVDACHDLDA
jgi:hypothetical protein